MERDTPGGSSGKAIALSKGCHIVFISWRMSKNTSFEGKIMSL